MNEFIIETLENCLNKDIKRFNALNGFVKVYGPSFEDLGDYLPSLIMFGKSDLWKQEIMKVVHYLKDNDDLYRDEGKGLLKQFTRCYSQTDLLWGLLLACKFDGSFKPYLEKPLEATYNNFFKGRENFLLATHVPFTKIKLPNWMQIKIKIMSSEDHGMYIEVFVLAYEITGEKKYLDIAHEIADKLYNSDFFAKHKFLEFYRPNTIVTSLLVSIMPQFSKRKGEFQLLKQNSNALFGMYALGKHVPEYSTLFNETIEQWIKDFFDSSKNVFYTNCNKITDKKGSDLTVFHMIELLILADKCDIAEKIAESILDSQSKKSGLVPFFHKDSEQKLKRMNAKLSSSWLDSAVDFGVALVRLYQKTKTEKYMKAAQNILKGIEALHMKEYGFCAEVHYETGDVVNPMYSAKMTGLVCKLSLAIEFVDEINNQEHVYYVLLQDR